MPSSSTRAGSPSLIYLHGGQPARGLTAYTLCIFNLGPRVWSALSVLILNVGSFVRGDVWYLYGGESTNYLADFYDKVTYLSNGIGFQWEHLYLFDLEAQAFDPPVNFPSTGGRRYRSGLGLALVPHTAPYLVCYGGAEEVSPSVYQSSNI